MSEYAVEIERMMVKLENLFMDSGNLSMNYFVRIENALNKMEQIDRQELKVVNEWWSNLQEDFKRLNRNYQDYLREFYSGKSDKVLKSIEFVVHKDRFISYLQEFVQQLQNKSIRIENIIKNLPQQMVDGVLERVIDSELAIPHPDSEIQDLRVNAIRENIYGKWQSLSDWFVPTDKHPSESQKVMDITDDVIRKIIQNAALIVQIQNWGISRKEDYKKFIQMFVQCKNVEEAHKLSAHIFGFPRLEQYEQFIRLLIKVRAPKLSKEFTPRKVYEILNDSLQTLSDEDLRAMVEAMEKMDDIQDRV